MRALFIGLGGIGQRHLRNLFQIEPNCEVGSFRFSDRRFEINNDLSINTDVDIVDKYSITLFSSFDETIEWKPDFVIISSPSNLHADQAAYFLQNDIPVLLEKPISHDQSSFNTLSKIVKECGTTLTVGYMLRFHPAFKFFEEKISSLDDPKFYSANIDLRTFMPKWHPYEAISDFYATNNSMGGGVVLTCVHPLDLFCSIFAKPISVHAMGGNLSEYIMDVEDSLSALAEFDVNGKTLPLQITMSFVQKVPAHKIRIFGNFGLIEWDEIKSSCTHLNGNDKEVKVFESFERNDMFVEELSHFIECIKANRKPLTSFEHCEAGHSLALAILKSLNSKEVVKL